MLNILQRSILLPITAFFILQFVACHQVHPGRDELYRKTEQLMTDHPDSAWQMLQTPLAYTTPKLTKQECAYYALLLARATDKCEKSLLSCDSLLDTALDYYDGSYRNRAIALLYKGRLEIEMAQSERAINFLLEGLDIIEKFPYDDETKRHLLSSLGSEYYNTQLYHKAKETYEELLMYCSTNKDKAIALNGIGSCYSMTNKRDSAFISQKKALEYALHTTDSCIIASSYYNLSIPYYEKMQYDSALYYTKKALNWCSDLKKKGLFYAQLANIFIQKEEIDSATVYLNRVLADSINFTSKEIPFILLNICAIKEREKEYPTVIDLLYKYIDITDSIESKHQSVKTLQQLYNFEIKKQIAKEQEWHQEMIGLILTSFLIICFIIILYYQHHRNKHDKLQLINEQRLLQIKSKYSSLQQSIEGSKHIIALLQKEQSSHSKEADKYKKEIIEQRSIIEKLNLEKEELLNGLFKQSDIYKKVHKLSEQKVSSKKELAVLSNNEFLKLKETVWNIYADYIATQLSQYPRLTNEDLLYLCLEKAGLSKQVISLCFGNTNTHALDQRKCRIKAKRNQI